MPTRGLFQIRATADDFIQLLTIIGRHILHVVGVFQPAFDLKARDARVDEFLQMRAVVEVFQTQQMTVLYQDLAILVEQVPRQATGLGTGATVGAAVADILAQIALSAMADTEGAVHEKLQWHGGLLTNLTDLLQAQLTAQDNLFETKLF